MTSAENDPGRDEQSPADRSAEDSSEPGRAPETPDVGLIDDEELPEDLQPTDDNPLAQDPDENDDDGAGEGPGSDKVEGMPDVGSPGAPA